jgi:prepilin-type N-terminal cleavage/methylation domain-containing protein
MRRRGFTLPELLIAAAVGSLILGLSVTAFSEIARSIAASRSRFDAQRHANTALTRVGDLVRRGHVFYYSARPMAAQTTVCTGRSGTEHAPRSALPDPLVDLAEVSVAPRPPGDTGFARPDVWLAAPTVSKRRFRFTSPTDDASGGGDPNFLLRVAPGKRTGDPYDDRFPGPLAYFAVADFRKTLTGDASNPTALLPRSWTFYVLYVAPMQLQANDPNFAMPGNPRDSLAPPVTGTNADRTAVPYELRLLTIPDVCAGAIAAPAGAYNVTTADGSLAANQGQYDPEGRRLLAPGAAPGADASFPDPPFDYDGRNASRRANYDPVPIPMTNPPAAAFDEDSLTTIFRYTLPSGARTGRPPSGPRIAGGGRHANFGMVGNDPPTAEVFGNRIAPQFADETGAIRIRPIADTLLMPYVDPDTVPGTSVRFVNNVHEPTAAPGADGRIALGAGGFYHRFIEPIGPGCDYFENRVHALTGNTTADTALGAFGVRPARALVSMSVRYRSRRDIPFQFATVTSEIPLDGIEQFSKVRPLP